MLDGLEEDGLLGRSSPILHDDRVLYRRVFFLCFICAYLIHPGADDGWLAAKPLVLFGEVLLDIGGCSLAPRYLGETSTASWLPDQILVDSSHPRLVISHHG